MKYKVLIFLVLTAALHAHSKAPKLQQQVSTNLFEETARYPEGIDMIGSPSSLDMQDMILSKYHNHDRYPELEQIRQHTIQRCSEKQREIELAAFEIGPESQLQVDFQVRSVARLLRSVTEHNTGIVKLTAEAGSVCHIIITVHSEQFALAASKTILGRKVEDCEAKLEEHKTPRTIAQKIKTGWSLLRWNYCRIEQYDLVKI
jgi:hypothetical protein